MIYGVDRNQGFHGHLDDIVEVDSSNVVVRLEEYSCPFCMKGDGSWNPVQQMDVGPASMTIILQVGETVLKEAWDWLEE